MLIKYIKRVFLGISTFTVVLLVIVLMSSVKPDQEPPIRLSQTVLKDSLVDMRQTFSLDSLKRIAGDNKKLPKGYEIQALLALSRYPELQNVDISFELIPTGAPMETTFVIPSLFLPKSNRQYLITLNDAPDSSFEPILLRSLPFDAQVGILAHELGHVVYYDQLNTFQIANWGLKYLMSEDFRATHEKTTDLMPVYYGLGWQIFEYAEYIRTDSTTLPLYELYADEFIDKYYLTHHEIIQSMKRDKRYQVQ